MAMSLRSLMVLAIIVLPLHCFAEEGVPRFDDSADVHAIVQAALQAEVDRDSTGRETLLGQALKRDPKDSAARWHSGYVRIGDQWLTVDQAEHSVAEQGTVTAYRDRRNLYSGNFAGELSLARWCRKHGLEERERMHWTNVLHFDPSNKEARGELGVREFRGQLLTAEQIEEWKQDMRHYQRALQEWDPRLSRWRREIESSSTPRLTEGWKQWVSLEDPEAVPSLEKMFPKLGSDLQREVVFVLGNLESQLATDALLRLSVDSSSPEIRFAAATELSDRSWFGFVPSLLGRLETPVECRYWVDTFGTGIVGKVRYSQEQSSAVVNVSHSINSNVLIKVTPNATEMGLARAEAQRRTMVAQEASRKYREILESLHAVQVSNARRAEQNERVFAALQTSTGQQLDARPQSWWEWWKGYNELEVGEEKPEFESRQDHNYQRSIFTISCFAAGTPVWTETGPVVIEDVRRGDRVLSQDPESGELTYQVVLDTTIRPPSPTLRIQVGDEEIVATLGHPIWVVGRGWKMAKELSVGDQLHGVAGGVTIDKIEAGPPSQAYNLVVAETSCYFVGKQRVLVHDNMPRRAMELAVPGWRTSSVAGVSR